MLECGKIQVIVAKYMLLRDRVLGGGEIDGECLR